MIQDKPYRVLYWAPSSKAWVEYIAPTHNARTIRHKTEKEARKRVELLQRMHPRDKFMVEGPR